MPRVVTTLRYVTTLGFMAYLTGMRVTDSSAWISSTKRAHLTLDSSGLHPAGIAKDGGFPMRRFSLTVREDEEKEE
ncbi:hypothetical protein ALC60_00252 [Trachymyrmex zeteki]|uniref:Uncharacterized protein n=1 Tax=Mycetomoellerius zeteki TaxID=64791 RepID=A0A151XJW3_9HYME|nr:hypothetical protein ALC60_00252 [Trachymyrmex zeteki]